MPQDDKIIGYRCPACKLLNTADRTHCLECGHWLLDSVHPAEIVTKNEYFKSIKSKEKTQNSDASIIAKNTLGIIFIIFCIALLYNLGHQENNTSTRIPEEKVLANNSNNNGSLKDNSRLNQSSEPIPENGRTFNYSTEDCIAPFAIQSGPGDTNHYVKLYEWDTKKPVISLFIRSGQNADIKVPLGSYEIKFASGKTWYGENNLFGVETIYTKAQGKFDFYISGNTIMGHTMKLYQQVGGNLKTQKIDPDEF